MRCEGSFDGVFGSALVGEPSEKSGGDEDNALAGLDRGISGGEICTCVACVGYGVGGLGIAGLTLGLVCIYRIVEIGKVIWSGGVVAVGDWIANADND